MRLQSLADLFHRAARWFFYCALVFAPWFYGATTPSGIVWLNWLLFVSLTCWVVELLVSWRFPRVSKLLVIGSFAALALGWWVVINAASFRDWQYETFVPRQQIIDGAAGSVDYPLSAAFMMRVTLLLGGVWFVVDSMRRPKFVLELWWVIVIAGTSISLLGLLQKATGAQMIFWESPPPGPEKPATTFFATYFYHANAGAFLNLTWPFATGLMLRSMERGDRPIMRAWLVSFFVIDLVAVMANTSRMAQLVGALTLLLFLGAFSPILWKRTANVSWRVTGGAVVFFVIVIGAIAYSSQWEQAIARWHVSDVPDAPGGGRLEAARVGWTAAKQAEWFGFGPGTFRAIFPRFQDQTDLEGKWIYLHEDYLQTIIEWGWLGAAMWAFLFCGGIWNGVKELWSNGKRILPRYRIAIPIALIALAGVAMHAVVDFPLQIASVQLYAAVCLGIAWGRAET